MPICYPLYYKQKVKEHWPHKRHYYYLSIKLLWTEQVSTILSNQLNPLIWSADIAIDTKNLHQLPHPCFHPRQPLRSNHLRHWILQSTTMEYPQVSFMVVIPNTKSYNISPMRLSMSYSHPLLRRWEICVAIILLGYDIFAFGVHLHVICQDLSWLTYLMCQQRCVFA